MINKKIAFFLSLFIFSLPYPANSLKQFPHPLYLGVLGGFGSTTWQGLVPSQNNQNGAISMSTPVRVQEGGQVWGAIAGYEFTPFFALEANYTSYPRSYIAFDPESLFTFNHNGLTQFRSDTETLGLMAKVMLVIPQTKMRVFSSAGVANIHRQDIMVKDWRVSPSFGLGFNYQISEHLMGELGGNYVAGYGESQLNPADSYFPFLYSVSLRLAYRI